MKIYSWNDLARFIHTMTPSERKEQIKIIVNDGPIVIAKEIERAADVYIRPRGAVEAGYERREVDLSNIDSVSQWERTMDKGEIFITAY